MCVLRLLKALSMNKFGWIFTESHERFLTQGPPATQVSNSSSNASKRSSELDLGKIFFPLTIFSEATEPF